MQFIPNGFETSFIKKSRLNIVPDKQMLQTFDKQLL